MLPFETEIPPKDSLVRGMVNKWRAFEKYLDHDTSDLISRLHHYSDHNLRTLFGNDWNREMNHNRKMHITKWCALQEIHAMFSGSPIFSLYLFVSVINHPSIHPLSILPPMGLAVCPSVYLSISVSSISISLSPVMMWILSSAKNSCHHAVLSHHKAISIKVIIDLNLWKHEPK